MGWDDALTELLDLLVRCYPDVSRARDVAEKAGLATRFIDFGGSLDNAWMGILREARKQPDGLAEIARVAQRDYPNVDFATLVRQTRGRPLAGPKPAGPSWKAPPAADGPEKVIGKQPTFLPISFLEIGLERARSVARVVCPDGLGTGFLTRDNLFITNHHVIAAPDVARAARIQFNYQETSTGLSARVAEFELAPEDGFATSPMTTGDDWTAVRCKGDPNREWGSLGLEGGPAGVDDYVNIIQHPGGLPKQIAMYHNVVVYVGGGRVQYLTDTLPGSSGSPVFDGSWRVVALHHSGGWITEPGSDGKRVFFRNEGIDIRAIAAGLSARGL